MNEDLKVEKIVRQFTDSVLELNPEIETMKRATDLILQISARMMVHKTLIRDSIAISKSAVYHPCRADRN